MHLLSVGMAHVSLQSVPVAQSLPVLVTYKHALTALVSLGLYLVLQELPVLLPLLSVVLMAHVRVI